MPSYDLKKHDNGTYYVHWTEGRRSKRVSTGQKEEAKAQIFLAQWILGDKEEQLNSGIELTVAEIWALYYERHVEKKYMDVRPADVCWNNLKDHFGALTLKRLVEKDEYGEDAVDHYVRQRQDGKIGSGPGAPATIRGEVSKLKTAINWAAHPRQKIIKPGDVPLIDLPPDSEARARWLTVEEIQKMLAAAVKLRGSERLTNGGARMSRGERFLWIALHTAARLAAILHLTWDRVDFETGMVHFNEPGRRRTKKRRTSVPMSSALRRVLELAYAERVSDYVLDTTVNTIWRAVTDIATEAKVEGVSPHVLRHTAASQMLRNGVSPWTVAGILADSVETVMRVYGHHCPENLKEGVDNIPVPIVLIEGGGGA